MPLTLRLARTGRKNIARYRLVAADSRNARDGRFVEALGYYNPEANPKEFTFKTERIIHWIKQGAVPSETVRNLLKQDNFFAKMEAVEKGMSLDTVTLPRKPEKKRKPKGRTKKQAAPADAAAAPAA